MATGTSSSIARRRIRSRSPGTVIESPLPEDVDVDWILPINDVKTGQPGLQVSLFRDDIARKRFPTVAFTYIEHAETFYSQLNDTPQPFVFEDGTEAPGLAAITIHNIRRCPVRAIALVL